MNDSRIFKIKRQVGDGAYDEPSGFADTAFLGRLKADIDKCAAETLAPVACSCERPAFECGEAAGADSEEKQP